MKNRFKIVLAFLILALVVFSTAIMQGAHAEVLHQIAAQGMTVLGFITLGVLLNLRSPLKHCQTKRFTAGSDITVIDADGVITPVLLVVGDVQGFVLENVLSGANGVIVYRTDSQGYIVPAATAAIGDGVGVYWDPDGDPVGGTAGSGAATATDDATHIFIGYAMEAKGGGDATVRTQLDVQPPAKAV